MYDQVVHRSLGALLNDTIDVDLLKLLCGEGQVDWASQKR